MFYSGKTTFSWFGGSTFSTSLKPSCKSGKGGALMFSALVSLSSGPGSSPGRRHCVVFLGKTLKSRTVSSPRYTNGCLQT